ncbi:acylphosphatase [Shewanella surugensis]|uniref:Acylphosphatase n=1 Tax=Shewanella surugensis TaxID=212020 RepID=A0ABT0LHV1_9GAMM|nr:acylphosphatase [Shewanella surugensis]MCL1127292.1 acylphosphatase [Shewanella surugensis]
MIVRTLKAIVTGRVQGVFFRAATKQAAITQGISGYAKNLATGEVEVEATGQESQLKAFIEYLKQGPAQAQVDDVVWDYIQAKSFEGFSIK